MCPKSCRKPSKIPSPVDVLWFVECYPAYHGRGKEASAALAKVLNLLGVDFGILGTEEKCSCDSQRLAGEVGLFEEFAEHNIALFNKYKFNKIMVTDPHALNALKKEYPKMGAEPLLPRAAQRRVRSASQAD